MKTIIKTIKFFSKDGTGYSLELNKFLESPNDKIQFNKEFNTAKGEHILK